MGKNDKPAPTAKPRGMDELARRLGRPLSELQSLQRSYRGFTIPKRTGGQRQILAPNPELKGLQRQILRSVLAGLPTHPAAKGFQPGESIVTNAVKHAGRALVISMDLKDFFPSIKKERVRKLFKKVGWDQEAAKWLATVCSHNGSLPQGAPTSPRLSNLANFRFDTRLHALTAACDGEYTRYADDLTFSFPGELWDGAEQFIRLVKEIAYEEGYRINRRKKVRIRRRHQCHEVTGLVVNDRPRLPRRTRRWLRAVEHHLETGRQVTLSADQLQGWLALTSMIAAQSGGSNDFSVPSDAVDSNLRQRPREPGCSSGPDAGSRSEPTPAALLSPVPVSVPVSAPAVQAEEGSLDQLFEALKQGTRDSQTCARSIEAQGVTGIEACIDRLGDFQLRERLKEVLALVGAPAVRPLASRLDDLSLRYIIKDILTAVGPQAEGELIAILPEVREGQALVALLEVLGSLGIGAAREQVAGLLRNDDFSVRSQAERTLSLLGLSYTEIAALKSQS